MMAWPEVIADFGISREKPTEPVDSLPTCTEYSVLRNRYGVIGKETIIPRVTGRSINPAHDEASSCPH